MGVAQKTDLRQCRRSAFLKARITANVFALREVSLVGVDVSVPFFSAPDQQGPAANGCEPLAPAYHGGREAFCDPFPSLIIQDEAHLLEESLGTFADLFETMLEQLFVRASDLLGDRVARSPFGAKPMRLPQVVAASATVSVPQQQFGALYQRRHMQFPYAGIMPTLVDLMRISLTYVTNKKGGRTWPLGLGGENRRRRR